jgi:hypothetical protein
MTIDLVDDGGAALVKILEPIPLQTAMLVAHLIAGTLTPEMLKGPEGPARGP